jgi:hypothetical protein
MDRDILPDFEDEQASAAPEHDSTALPENAPFVLVIDDKHTTRDLFKRWLSREGFRVECASSGEEALRLARELHPAIATVDIRLGDTDGWTVLSTIKSDPNLADIRVIVVSVVDDKSKGYALGASDYLVKPVNRARLVGVVRRYCSGRESDPILLVEDDDASRSLVRQVLLGEGFTVVEATDGEEGLRCVSQRRPALILLDLMMPAMDGFSFLEELRKNEVNAWIPVVVITAKLLTAEDRRRLNGGVDKILEKGEFSSDRLLHEISMVIRKHLPHHRGYNERPHG